MTNYLKKKNPGKEYTEKHARSEIIARACEDMLKMSERGKRIFTSLSENDRKTLIEKIKGLVNDLLNWVNDLLNSYESTSTEARIMREYKEELQKAAKIWDEMLGKSIKANQSLEKSGKFGHNNSDGNVVYSLREEAISEVEQAISNKNYDKEIKLTDSSPAILTSQKGVKNLPMMMVASHIRENILTEKEARALGLKVNSGINYHGLGKTLFLKVIDGLDNVTEAYRGTKNAEDTSRRENYFLLISQYKDSDGNTINVPVYINEKGRYNKIFIDTNKIATVFGRDELRKYIKNQIANGNLVRIKNRSTQASESQSPIDSDYSKSASKDSISNSNEKVNTKFSDRDVSLNMSEDERYEILKEKQITPVQVVIDKTTDIDFEYLENNIKSVVEKGLLKKFQGMGLFKKYESIVLSDVSFDFTGKGFRKSLHSQENLYGGSKADFAKVLLDLQRLLDSSILIEMHTDKGKGTPKEKRGLEKVYVLFSAMYDNNSIVPVQFEVEQYITDENRLYLAVALTKIETSVKGNTAPDEQKATSLLPVSNISISEIFSKINPYDKNFLKYIPNQFLNEEQIKAKNEALAKEMKKYFGGEDIRYSERDYSYESLVAKPDMKLTVLDANVPNNRADIIHQAKKNAAKVGNVNEKDKTVSVYVDDIEKDIVLGTDGLQHGLSRGRNIQNRPISIVTLKAGEIIKNSIRINELTPSKVSAIGSYILIGASVDSNDNLYIVRSVINEYNNKLASMDVLYAINTKKESAVLNAPRYANSSLSVTDSTISIAELLDYVNKYFPDILPESVLKHYGYDARPDGELGEDALYSEREDISVYDIMGEKDRLLKENEKLKADIERLNERLKIEKKVTKGSILNNNQLLNAAGHLRKISNSSIDKVELARSLKDVYSFIGNAENLTWEEVFEKCHTIAETMLEKAKPEVMVDDYYKQILKDIKNTKISLSESQKKEAQNIFDKNWNRYFFGKVIITDKGIGLESKWQEWLSIRKMPRGRQ